MTGRWYSPDTPVFSNKTDCHDISEILLKPEYLQKNTVLLKSLTNLTHNVVSSTPPIPLVIIYSVTLSIPNLLWTDFCVPNRHVFGLYKYMIN